LTEAVIGKEVDSIFQEGRNRSYCALVDSLSDYISWRFDDLHFFIEQPEEGACAMVDEGKVKGPVRVVDIHDKLYVGANFDPAYTGIRINDEVVAIDGIPIRAYYDSTARNWFKTTALSPYKKHVVVSALLDRGKADSCKLQIRSGQTGVIREYTIRYDGKYVIPDAFRAVHCEYREYDSVYAYYKINYWEQPVYLRFINHWAEISRSKGVIIDLRGNGGGGVMSAMQLYAIFTGNVSTFYNYVTEDGALEPVMVLPDTVFKIPIGEKVVIIGDETTACTSEAFIKAMRQRGNVYFIASTNTVGSLATKFDIKLPTGVIVHTNAIQHRICYTTADDVIEGKGGVAPDVLVNIDKVEDLRPYQDKLLREAIKILSADKRD
jgi:C-terminal processing protease CtpA/Prc